MRSPLFRVFEGDVSAKRALHERDQIAFEREISAKIALRYSSKMEVPFCLSRKLSIMATRLDFWAVLAKKFAKIKIFEISQQNVWDVILGSYILNFKFLHCKFWNKFSCTFGMRFSQIHNWVQEHDLEHVALRNGLKSSQCIESIRTIQTILKWGKMIF